MGKFIRGLLQTETHSAGTFTSGRPGPGLARPAADPADGAARAARGSQRTGQPRPGESIADEPDCVTGDNQQEHPHTQQTEEPDAGLPDLRPLRLQMSQAEIKFMERLGALMPTPRAAKRLANLYRLVRIGIPDSRLADFIGAEEDGPYQAVQVLLAVLVGSPAAAQHIFREIRSAPGGSDIRAVFAEASDFTEGDFCGRIHLELGRISSATSLLTAVEEYQHWLPALARYSFHTRAMTGDPPVSDASSVPDA